MRRCESDRAQFLLSHTCQRHLSWQDKHLWHRGSYLTLEEEKEAVDRQRRRREEKGVRKVMQERWWRRVREGGRERATAALRQSGKLWNTLLCKIWAERGIRKGGTWRQDCELFFSLCLVYCVTAPSDVRGKHTQMTWSLYSYCTHVGQLTCPWSLIPHSRFSNG